MACLAIVGGAGVGGLVAGFNTRAGLSPPPSTTVVAAIVEMAPSDKVGLRFPPDWAEPAAEPVARMVTLASADPGMMLFSPQPTYAANDAAAPNMIEAKPKPAADADAPTVIEAKPKPAAAARPKVALASAAPVAPKPPKPRSNAVLNDSQLASIKRRLNLTPDQERYWPAIEAELRKMEYTRNSQGGSRTASIDMSKVNVEGLKSAGFPLVMSFSDDQRRELKSLTHLLGLDSVMAGL
jgi:hypothetical protein